MKIKRDQAGTNFQQKIGKYKINSLRISNRSEKTWCRYGSSSSTENSKSSITTFKDLAAANLQKKVLKDLTIKSTLHKEDYGQD